MTTTFLTLQKDQSSVLSSRRHSAFTIVNRDGGSSRHSNWDKVLNKVYYNLIPEDEQDTSSLPVGTGIHFLRGLIDAEKHVSNLKIRIPDTLCIANGSNLILNDSEGNLAIIPSSIQMFYNYLFAKYQPTPSQLMMPACVLKISDKTSFKSEVWNWNVFAEKVTHGVIAGFNYILLQEFIKHKNPITSYRIITEPGTPQKAPYGICRCKAATPQESNKHLITYSNNDFTFFIMGESAIRPFLSQMHSLTVYLNRAFSYMITYLVCDFVKNDYSVYLTGIRFMTLETQCYDRIIHMGVTENKIKKESLLPSKCKLCQLKFKKSELIKTVPLKMLIELKDHYARRGMFTFKHLEHIPYQIRNHNVQICDLCYYLITEESILIHCEKLLADASNIPFNDVSEADCLGSSEKTIKHPPLLPNTLNQWRSLIYISMMRDIDSNLLLKGKPYSLKFKIFPNSETCFNFNQEATEKLRKSRSGNYSISPSPRITKFSHKSNKQYSLHQLRVNQMRVHYFFSQDKDIKRFVDDTKINISLFQEAELIAQGSCSPFKNFNLFESDVTSQVHKLNVFLFTSLMKRIEIEIKCGLCFDDKMDVSTFSVYKMPESNIYYPDDCYYNAYVLPVEWMKLFNPSYEVAENEDEANYSSVINACYRTAISNQGFVMGKVPKTNKIIVQKVYEEDESVYVKEIKECRTFSVPSSPINTSFNNNARNKDRSLCVLTKTMHTEVPEDKGRHDYPNTNRAAASPTAFNFLEPPVVFNDAHFNYLNEHKTSGYFGSKESVKEVQPPIKVIKPQSNHKILNINSYHVVPNTIDVRPQSCRVRPTKQKQSSIKLILESTNLLPYGDTTKTLTYKKIVKPRKASSVLKQTNTKADNQHAISIKAKHKLLMKRQSMLLLQIENRKNFSLIQPYVT